MATAIEHKVRGQVQTTDGTNTLCASYTVPVNSVVFIRGRVTGRRTDEVDLAAYAMEGSWYEGGAVGTPVVTAYENAGALSWPGATWNLSGNDVRIFVQGEAALTIDWSAQMDIYLYTP